ncbi:MAG: cysteine desulfurase [Chitinophagales bacterium]|nr:cysteine desulfurase [Chitinophagales bacterium]
MKVYLDNAATTALSKEVLESMMPYMTEIYGNPSSTHSFGRASKSGIEHARKTISQYLKCKPSEIIFTSSGTEANNTAIKCSVRDLGIKNIISSRIEHHCVLHTVEEMEKAGIHIHYVNLTSAGLFDLEHLEQLLKSCEGKTLVSVMHANNELGNIMDIEAIGALCKQHNALFHTDTVQTIAHMPFDLSNSNIDFLSASAHKFHGPKGVGFLYIKHQSNIASFIHGGSQERSMRAGTENVSGIVGLGKALQLAYDHLESDAVHMTKIKNYFIEKLQESIPDIEFNTNLNSSLFTVLNVSLPKEYNNEMTLFNLDIKGIACSAGSACSSGSNKGSHVLQAINHSPERKAIRFSFSKYTTTGEIDYTIEKLKELALAESI